MTESDSDTEKVHTFHLVLPPDAALVHVRLQKELLEELPQVDGLFRRAPVLARQRAQV